MRSLERYINSKAAEDAYAVNPNKFIEIVCSGNAERFKKFLDYCSKQDLTNVSLRQLHTIAQGLRITNYKRLSRLDLIREISNVKRRATS